MKNILNILITGFLALSIYACSSQKLASGNKGITGTWRMTEALSDPGDGSGKWEAIPKDTVRLVAFNPDGTMTGDAIWGATHYKVVDTANISITIQGNTAPLNYRYKVTQNTLVLNPPCREACGIRFTRVNSTIHH